MGKLFIADDGSWGDASDGSLLIIDDSTMTNGDWEELREDPDTFWVNLIGGSYPHITTMEV